MFDFHIFTGFPLGFPPVSKRTQIKQTFNHKSDGSHRKRSASFTALLFQWQAVSLQRGDLVMNGIGHVDSFVRAISIQSCLAPVSYKDSG